VAEAKKIDPFDVEALERAVNDSAGRVSGIWLSFVAFSAYLAAAASMVSHRQVFLEEPIKLPTINIDLPLAASAVLLPLLFVIYHLYALLQVVLLSRTADAYNEAIEKNVEGTDRTRVRQRLANTLFAQLFAGSERERKGALGWLLRLMAWATLAVGPVLVLFLFELKFLPYHSTTITWAQRALIAADLLAVLLLWATAINPRQDVSWQTLRGSPVGSGISGVLVLISLFLVAYPGEWTRWFWRPFNTDTREIVSPTCHTPRFIAAVFPMHFDRLWLPHMDFMNNDVVEKSLAAAKARGVKWKYSTPTRSFEGRDLSCATFSETDLRGADFGASNLVAADFQMANLRGARFKKAQLSGASFFGANLEGADFVWAQLDKSSFNANAKDGDFRGANLLGADLALAELQGADLRSTDMRGVNLSSAQLQGSEISSAMLQGANLSFAVMTAADLSDAHLEGANLTKASLQGANLRGAILVGADLTDANLEGADLSRAHLQGSQFDRSAVSLANFSNAFIWRTRITRCDDAYVPQTRDTAMLPMMLGDAELPTPTDVTPQVLDQYIFQTSKGMTDAAKTTVESILRNRLSTEDSVESRTAQRLWSDCSSAPRSRKQYDSDLGAYLVGVACRAGDDQKYVAHGIYELWVDFDDLRSTFGKVLSRGLLGLDKPCPGSAELGEKEKMRLREPPAKNDSGSPIPK
jgi:uncharacterized protein YjbI with pentapeptide repeats/succinate dehydrogenase hydrophobic anchor subunit